MEVTIEKRAMIQSTQPPCKRKDDRVWGKLGRQLRTIKWSNVIILLVLHLVTLLGPAYLFLYNTIKVPTIAFTIFLGAFSGLGMAVGAHRLWAHRSFKARLPLRLFLVFFQTLTMNGSALSYARDHRTHHKYSDTEGDPKNPSRGLVYSHIGWWMLRKTQTVKEHGNKLDFTDLTDDWMLYWQHRLYTPLFIILGLLLPISIPCVCWNETLPTATIVTLIRITTILHHLFTVNSLSHFFGARPFDYRMRPTENRLVIYLSLGEGNHNFHHTFPYDFTSSGAQVWESFNPCTVFIKACQSLGLAYDCKYASRSAIEGTIRRIGVPAYFDPQRGLPFRILSGILDWFLGTLVAFSSVWFGFLLVSFFERQIIVPF